MILLASAAPAPGASAGLLPTGVWWDWEGLPPQPAGRIDGISDQNLASWSGAATAGSFLSFFRASWVGEPPSHIRFARYVVQWNVIANRSREPFTHYYQALAAWYQAEHELGLIPDIALGLYTGSPPASPADYRRALEELLGAFPAPFVEAWDEPNHTPGLTAARAAAFMNEAYAYCGDHGCTAIAGDFLDSPGSASYAEEYERGLSPTEYPQRRNPPEWAVHPYAAVNRGGGEALAIKRLLDPGDNLWITEIGAYFCEAPDRGADPGEAGQAAAAARLLDSVMPALDPAHVFYYELMYKDGEPTPCARESDTALYAGPADRARAAASIVLDGY